MDSTTRERTSYAAVDQGIDVRQRSIRTAKRAFAKRPSSLPFFIAFAITLFVSLYAFDAHTSILGWIFTFIWSMPAVSTVVGMYGMLLARRRMREIHDVAGDVDTSLHDKLIVVVPTIGRHDTYPALERS